MFHRTRTPLRLWFWALFLVARDKRGHSALQLSKGLGIPYDRAWLMLHKIRSAMAHRDSRYQLNGDVELDEAYFGAPDPEGKGRGTSRVKALVAVSVTADGKPRFAKIQKVTRLDARRVKRFSAEAIEPGSRIRTDGLNVYRCLKQALRPQTGRGNRQAQGPTSEMGSRRHLECQSVHHRNVSRP
jgi:hypothetical protein